jgi:hypothetical protein
MKGTCFHAAEKLDYDVGFVRTMNLARFWPMQGVAGENIMKGEIVWQCIGF